MDGTVQKWQFFLYGVIVGACAALLISGLMNRTRPAAIVIEPPAERTPVSDATPETLFVYVSGAVTLPGVYQLPPGSRIDAALRAAGGVTSDAADTLNLAAPLSDGLRIHVPTQTEAQSGAFTAPVSETRSEPVISIAPGGALKININTASLQELELIPGVGPAIAQRIVDYRQTNGNFTHIADIMNVSGIGESKFADMQEYITIGE